VKVSVFPGAQLPLKAGQLFVVCLLTVVSF